MTAIDKPTDNDKFGFEPYVKGIADLVRQTKSEDLPITIGIYGAWGVGKTSFIMQLEKQLISETPYKLPTVWFEAWQYDHISDVRSALIFNILSKLRTDTHGNTKSAITKAFRKVLKASTTLALNTQFSISAPGVSITPPTGEQLTSDIDKVEEFRTSVDSLTDGFSEAVSVFLAQYSEDEQKKLVIFIDDLDRCLPEHVITVLEALKLFLDKAPCVFVIAVDRIVVENAIQNHYGSNPSISGREYLDKIIQLPFTVPPANPTNLKKYIAELLNAEGLDDTCLKIFSTVAEGNPRIYLRLVTSWKLYSSLAPHVLPNLWTNGSKRHVLAMAVALHLCWPSLRELAIKNPQGLHSFANLCVEKSSNEPIDTVLTRVHAREYLPFWENNPVRTFFYRLDKNIGGNIGTILGSPEDLKAALELCIKST